MDLDRYLVTHQKTWDRMTELGNQAARHPKTLTQPQIAELIALYQRVSTHLSYVRTYYRDPGLTSHLTRLVSVTASALYGTQPHSLRTFARFFTTTFPAAVWWARKFVMISAALTFVPALAVGIWLANSHQALDIAAPPAVREAYVNHDFQSYYESRRASQFASHVYTNNVGVALSAWAGGMLFAIPTIGLLVANGANIGEVGAMFYAVGQAGKFWGLITPHGMVELTSVVIAGGAGLLMGWTMIAPGDRRRSVALAEEGRRAIAIALGLAVTLAVAGFIEGFVTGQPWPTWIRVGIGTIAELGLLAYLLILGRSAARRGYTGQLGEGQGGG